MIEQQANQEAKRLLQGVPHRKVTLVYLLLTAGLSFCVGMMVPDLFSILLLALATGDQQSAMAALNYGGGTLFFLSLLLILYKWVMKVGYALWALRIVGEEPVGFSTLLEGFGFSGRVIFLQLMQGMYLYLWALGLGTLCSLVLVLPLTYLGLEILAGMLLIPGVVAISLFLHLRYCFVRYCLVDHPEQGAMGALRSGVFLMRQRYGQTFGVLISLWRWFLLYFLVLVGLNYLSIAPGIEAVMASEGLVLSPEMMEELLMTEGSAVYDWIGLFFSWGFALLFLPVYHVTMGVHYRRCRQAGYLGVVPPGLE